MTTELATNPSKLMEIALNANADVDKLEKLMAMQERWDAGNARKAYFEALAEFQNKAPAIKKQKAGHNYMYAPLSDIVSQIKTALYACGLSYRFEQSHVDGIEITCVVTHTGGHSERTTMKGAPDTTGSKNIIQAAGSTVTYLQRYTLIGALGISTADEDMDGRIGNEVDHQELYEKLLQHIACVRDNFDEVVNIKTAIANDDFALAKTEWTDLGDDEKSLLWLAPTKGGILTSEERNVLKMGKR